MWVRKLIPKTLLVRFSILKKQKKTKNKKTNKQKKKTNINNKNITKQIFNGILLSINFILKQNNNWAIKQCFFMIYILLFKPFKNLKT